MKIATYGVTVALAIGALAATACGSGKENSAAAPVHNVFVVNPVASGAGQSRSFSAVTQEARSIATGFKTAGQIERILVKEGDHVNAGQLLAELDTVDYALGVSQLRVQHRQMADEFERRRKIYASGSMSDNDFEKARAGLEQLALQLALQENKLRYCRLYAPASGYITKRNFEPSEMVDAGTPVFELMDNSHLEVLVDLPVADYMQRGSFVGFSGHSALHPGVSFPLNMLSITPRADNNQLYQLKLTLPASSPVSLTPGMNLTVDIEMAGTDSPAVELPRRAVFDHDGQDCVWVLSEADSTVHARPVAITRHSDPALVTVTSGLQVTDRVVRAGVHSLTEGERVNVITPATETNVGNLL